MGAGGGFGLIQDSRWMVQGVRSAGLVRAKAGKANGVELGCDPVTPEWPLQLGLRSAG